MILPMMPPSRPGLPPPSPPYLAHGVDGAEDNVVQVPVPQEGAGVRPEGVLEGRPHAVQGLAGELRGGGGGKGEGAEVVVSGGGEVGFGERG